MKIDIKNKKEKGFVLLFTMLLSSIILAIALGVTQIALKEVKFSTSASDTNAAFFAADTGAECALYYDKTDVPFGSVEGMTLECAGNSVTPSFLSQENESWRFALIGLGNGTGCTSVRLSRDINTNTTTIVSKGYSKGVLDDNGYMCEPLPNSVERQLEVSY